MNRDAIYAAFFSRFEALATAGTFTTASRNLAFVETLDSSALPAIYQNQTGEEVATFANGGTCGWVFDVDLYLYAMKGMAPDPSMVTLNPLMDAVYALLGTDDAPGNFNVTVDGDDVAHSVWVNGYAQTWEGILGDRNVHRIPVRIYVPYS